MLEPNPDLRYSAKECLSHEFFHINPNMLKIHKYNQINDIL
jgi:hypothetical protein